MALIGVLQTLSQRSIRRWRLSDAFPRIEAGPEWLTSHYETHSMRSVRSPGSELRQ